MRIRFMGTNLFIYFWKRSGDVRIRRNYVRVFNLEIYLTDLPF